MAAARQSVSQVVLLHALASSAGRQGSIPSSQIPRSAKTVATGLASGIHSSTMLQPPSGSAGAELVGSLRVYQGLAGQLARRPAADGDRVPASFWTTLKSADRRWLAALALLRTATGIDLTHNMAPLLYPS
jgi:hypothetical protein